MTLFILLWWDLDVKRDKMDYKHDMVSIMVSHFIDMGSDFVKGDREHSIPIDHEALLSTI